MNIAATWLRPLLPLVPASILLASLGSCSCAAHPGATSKPRPRPTAERAEPRLHDGGWGILGSRSLGLKLALPDADGWLEPRARPAPGASWELRHAATGSTLSLRRWRASRLPRIDACEAQLRDRVPGLARPDEVNLVAQRDLRLPAGFLTRVSLVAVGGNAARLQGQVVAVGAGVGECLAVVARTECTSETELAERLRLFDIALGHLHLSQIEDRVPRAFPP